MMLELLAKLAFYVLEKKYVTEQNLILEKCLG